MDAHTRGDDVVIEALVEIPVGSRNKYEYDEKRGMIKLDRVLYASVHYPTDYGLIVDTLAPDGDPLDVLILSDEPVFPGCLVDVRPIGVMRMRDMGAEDDKIVAVEVRDPRMGNVHALSDVSPHRLAEIENFFNTYKDLEGKQTEVIGWKDADEAIRIVGACREAYQTEHKG